MGFFSEPWLREARDRIKSFRDGSRDAPPRLEDFKQLAEAVEKAIKAALIENHGSLPLEHNHTKLVSLCQTTGVWDVLPPALKGLVQEVESYRAKDFAAAQPSPGESSAEQLRRYFFVARRLIDYMEFHVIGNESVLKRLKVA